MSWYSAVLLFECVVGEDVGGGALVEESTRLLQAGDDAEANVRAEQLGRDEEHEYLNASGALVRWKFVRVLELQDLCTDSLEHGTEVFSRMRRRSPESEED